MTVSGSDTSSLNTPSSLLNGVKSRFSSISISNSSSSCVSTFSASSPLRHDELPTVTIDLALPDSVNNSENNDNNKNSKSKTKVRNLTIETQIKGSQFDTSTLKHTPSSCLDMFKTNPFRSPNQAKLELLRKAFERHKLKKLREQRSRHNIFVSKSHSSMDFRSWNKKCEQNIVHRNSILRTPPLHAAVPTKKRRSSPFKRYKSLKSLPSPVISRTPSPKKRLLRNLHHRQKKKHTRFYLITPQTGRNLDLGFGKSDIQHLVDTFNQISSQQTAPLHIEMNDFNLSSLTKVNNKKFKELMNAITPVYKPLQHELTKTNISALTTTSDSMLRKSSAANLMENTGSSSKKDSSTLIQKFNSAFADLLYMLCK